MKQIGFIGLGHMGNPMALRLLQAGLKVKVYDIAKTAVTALTAHGAIAANSIADVCHEVDAVITMLQSSAQINSVCLGKEGVFSNVPPAILYIDCSSIELETTLALHEEAKTFGVHMLDAPVSGGVTGAKAGTLTVMVGGSDKDFLQAESLFKHLGKKIIHAGNAGHGQAAKICNNLMLGISMIGTSEGLNLAEKLGLDLKKFYEIAVNSSGQSWPLTSYCPVPGLMDNVPANNHYQAGFTAAMMLKDLRLGQHAAESVDAVTPLGAMAMELYSLYVNQGSGELDFSGIINMLKG